MSLVHLDTHVLVWMLKDSPELGSETWDLADAALAGDRLEVSAIAFWEIALLLSKNRLDLPFAAWEFREFALRHGVVEVPLDGRILVDAVDLAGLHPDPADRIVCATALARGATLLTVDQRLLDWRAELSIRNARL